MLSSRSESAAQGAHAKQPPGTHAFHAATLHRDACVVTVVGAQRARTWKASASACSGRVYALGQMYLSAGSQ